MKCKKIKDLLITDYTDGELNEALEKEVREHLKTCTRCSRFAEDLRQISITQFKKAAGIKAPESIWYAIKRTLEQEQPKGSLTRVTDSLQALFLARRPALTAATVIAVILIAVVLTRMPFNRQTAVNEYLDEQVTFMSYLAGDKVNHYDMDDMDLGTAIEKYLL